MLYSTITQAGQGISGDDSNFLLCVRGITIVPMLEEMLEGFSEVKPLAIVSIQSGVRYFSY
ncbi:MAG: hypothetical protein K0Q73_4399 [Paenibacillus sp.]|nr:hypothetical protein [Paenibacillus sp.]